MPIYLHPSVPHPAVIDAYYKDYSKEWPGLLRAAWGFTVETATQGLRLVLSGVFDAYPRLRIILGHLGEGLPFFLWRINMALGRERQAPSSFRDTFSEHFYDHHQRLLVRSRAAVLRSGDGSGSHHVLSGRQQDQPSQATTGNKTDTPPGRIAVRVSEWIHGTERRVHPANRGVS